MMEMLENFSKKEQEDGIGITYAKRRGNPIDSDEDLDLDNLDL